MAKIKTHDPCHRIQMHWPLSYGISGKILIIIIINLQISINNTCGFILRILRFCNENPNTCLKQQSTNTHCAQIVFSLIFLYMSIFFSCNGRQNCILDLYINNLTRNKVKIILHMGKNLISCIFLKCLYLLNFPTNF